MAGQTFARTRRLFEPIAKLRELGKFDVVNYQLGLTLFSSPVSRYADLRMLKSSGARLSYYGLGCDEASLLRVRPDVESLPCTECMAYDANGKNCAKLRLNRRPRASRGARLFDFAVSAAYIYDHGLDFFPNASKAKIQFPIDTRGLGFSPALARPRPLIVHSPTKVGFKGTRHVLEALRLLAERRDDFEFRLVRGLSHADYIRTMQDCDIYVDQILSADSFGIAALENMACGKVVVSGNGRWGGAASRSCGKRRSCGLRLNRAYWPASFRTCLIGNGISCHGRAGAPLRARASRPRGGGSPLRRAVSASAGVDSRRRGKRDAGGAQCRCVLGRAPGFADAIARLGLRRRCLR